MLTAGPFANNTGSSLPNTAQYGNLAVLTGSPRPDGIDLWDDPDGELGYVIVSENPDGNQTKQKKIIINLDS